MAVAVGFEVGLVVAQVVADQIGQREAVVRDHVVDRFGGRAPAGLVMVGRTRQAQREFAARAVAAQPEGPDGVAEAVVPFEPAFGEAAQLVAARPQVPGLGDELHALQRRVLQHGLEEGAIAVETEVATAQHGRQVEAEAVDVHVLYPVAQAVQHHLQDARVADVHRVAAAAQVLVAVARAGSQPVPAGVVQAAPADRGPALVTLGGVVVDDIQQHLDAGRVQAAHHLAELVARVRRGGVARLQAEEAQRVVAPVVAQAALRQAAFVQNLLNRQQAQRGDAQPLEMRQRLVAGQRGVAALEGGFHPRQLFAEATHMHLVKHRVGQRRARRAVALPVEVVIDHPRLVGPRRVVVHVHVLRVLRIGAEVRGLPVEPPGGRDDLARPGVQQQLVRVEAVAAVGPPGAVRAQAVHQAGRCPGQMPVPDVATARRQGRARQRLAALRVEQAQVDLRGVGREDSEVDAAVLAPRAQRPRLAGRQVGSGQRRCSGRGPPAQPIHSRNTVASGGRFSTSDCARPWLCTGSLAATPSGVPTLLPP